MAKLRTWKGLSILVALALVLSLGAVAVLMVGTVGAQTERHVAINCTGIPSPCYTSIQAAINASAPGDTILVHPGKYTEHLVIDKSLTLQSTDGWQDTTIDPVGDSIIRIEDHVDVTVQGFEISAGSWGIYIYEVFSTVNILDCFIHDNHFDGIHVVGGGDVLNIEDNIISQNGLDDASCGIYVEQAWSTVNILNNIIGAWWGGPAQPIYVGNDKDGVRIDNVPAESNVAIWRNLIAENGDDGVDFPSLASVHGSVSIGENAIGAWPCYYEGVGTHNFTGNENHGIHVGEISDTGTVNIEANAISENGDDGINFGQGAGAILGEVIIRENLIGAWTCYSGDYGYTGAPERYTGNFGEGIYIYQVGEAGASGTVTIEHNKISENGYDTGISIDNIYGVVTIAENDIGAWEDSHGETYLGNEGQGIRVTNVYSGAELTIGPDNSIKQNTSHGIDILWGELDSSIEIHHNFIDDPVVDSCGIKLGSGGVCGAMVRDNIITNNYKGIHLDMYSTQNTIQNNEIRDNAEGIWVEGDDNQILRNNILNNKGAPISGIHLTSTAERNVIHCNNIVGNLPYGLYYEITNFHSLPKGMYNQNGDEAVDATGNWWGCIEGPGAAGCDLVFGNVIYDPWLLDEFQNCEECVGAPPPPGVPTVNHWGIVAMITLFAGLLVWTVRRRLSAS
jgi:parallel beta-helix repeat protein